LTMARKPAKKTKKKRSGVDKIGTGEWSDPKYRERAGECQKTQKIQGTKHLSKFHDK